MSPGILFAAALLLAGSGCTSRTALTNEGPVCALSSADPYTWEQGQEFVAGNVVYLRYSIDECLSGSCDVDPEASCTVTAEGQTLVVESRAAWSSSRVGPCTEDCRNLIAVCESPPLQAGTYVVRHGSEEVTLTIPSTPAQAPCTATPRL